MLSGRFGGIFLFLFAIPFLSVGGAMLWFFFLQPSYKSMRAQAWPEAPAEIVGSGLEVAAGIKRATTHRVDIRYHYTYRNRKYTSDQYDFTPQASSERKLKEEIVARYPIGSTTTAYVNPDKPYEAVLSRGFEQHFLFAGILVGGPFTLAGLVMLYAGLRTFFSARSRTKSLSKRGRRLFEEAKHEAPIPVTGALILKPSQGPWQRFLIIAFVAIFWNGLTSLFIAQVVNGWMNGESPIGQTLFLIPFVLIGVLLLFVTGQSLLQLFNPRPTLTLTPGHVPLAGTGVLEWRFNGNVTRLDNLTIHLVGKEKATYRVGTNTRTAESTFEDIKLYETDSPADIASGRVEFTMPEFTMHSFKAPNNEIAWELKVAGTIDNWPDVDNSFEVTVTPLESR